MKGIDPKFTKEMKDLVRAIRDDQKLIDKYLAYPPEKRRISLGYYAAVASTTGINRKTPHPSSRTKIYEHYEDSPWFGSSEEETTGTPKKTRDDDKKTLEHEDEDDEDDAEDVDDDDDGDDSKKGSPKSKDDDANFSDDTDDEDKTTPEKKKKQRGRPPKKTRNDSDSEGSVRNDDQKGKLGKRGKRGGSAKGTGKTPRFIKSDEEDSNEDTPKGSSKKKPSHAPKTKFDTKKLKFSFPRAAIPLKGSGKKKSVQDKKKAEEPLAKKARIEDKSPDQDDKQKDVPKSHEKSAQETVQTPQETHDNSKASSSKTGPETEPPQGQEETPKGPLGIFLEKSTQYKTHSVVTKVPLKRPIRPDVYFIEETFKRIREESYDKRRTDDPGDKIPSEINRLQFTSCLATILTTILKYKKHRNFTRQIFDTLLRRETAEYAYAAEFILRDSLVTTSWFTEDFIKLISMYGKLRLGDSGIRIIKYMMAMVDIDILHFKRFDITDFIVYSMESNNNILMNTISLPQRTQRCDYQDEFITQEPLRSGVFYTVKKVAVFDILYKASKSVEESISIIEMLENDDAEN